MADRQLTDEDIKNMSPEQIQELQKQNCIFCHIISGKIPAKKIYEDDKTLTILDINPAAKGHMLLMPKEHHMILPQLSDDMIKHLGIISKKLSMAALRSLQAQGTNIFIANGAVAGQRAPHIMVHIIPRYDGDSISCFTLPEKAIREEDYAQMHAVLSQRFGIRHKEPKHDIEPAKERAVVEEQPQEKHLAVQSEQSKEHALVKQTTFITSEKAKRFHINRCPFAEKIPEESRIYLTEEQAFRERVPCECTGLRKKKLQEVNLKELEKMFK